MIAKSMIAILHIGLPKDLAAEVRENDIGNLFVAGVKSRVAMYGHFRLCTQVQFYSCHVNGIRC